MTNIIKKLSDCKGCEERRKFIAEQMGKLRSQFPNMMFARPGGPPPNMPKPNPNKEAK